MDQRKKLGDREKDMFPLNEEDIAQAFGDVDTEPEEPVEKEHSTGFFRLFITIVLAAPVAAFLTLIVMDIYPPIAETIGLRSATITALPEDSVTKPGKADSFTALLKAMQKSNKSLAAAMNRQADAIKKLAAKKPGTVKVTIPPIKIPEIKIPPIKFPAQPKAQVSITQQKIVVVRVPSREKFDLAYEKQKILELSGVDLDDPVTGSQIFSKIKSWDALKEVIRSLDDIIAAARDHDEVTDFLKANALKAKKYATKRLSVLR